MIGRTLAHYEILEEISRGGMGVVYKAFDPKLQREVAIKVLPPELVVDPERKRRFIQEARAAAALNHPYIATIFDIVEAEGVSFIVMEMIEGEHLGDLLARETPRRGLGASSSRQSRLGWLPSRGCTSGAGVRPELLRSS